MSAKYGFAGMSHLGIVSSIAVAAKGFHVVSYDADKSLTDALSKRELPVHEPDLDSLLKDKAGKNISFTSDLAALGSCDLVYASLDVKTDANNRSDLSALTALIESLLTTMKSGSILVVLSQVPPGFTRKLATRHANKNVQIFGQVETLIFGRAVERAMHPERYIIGCADPSMPLPDVFKNLLSAFDCPILPMRYESSELAKISINMYLVSTVSVTNTLAEICENIGAEWAEIAPALRLDKRIGQYAYLTPGLGIAGGNLERDLVTISSISKEFGTDSGIVDAWTTNSRYRRDWALRTLYRTVISRTQNPVIAVWGLAYKQDTHSIKNSPSMALIESMGTIVKRTYDPQVVLEAGKKSAHLQQFSTALEACDGADALIIMTPWKEFAAADLSQVYKKLKGKTVIDPHNMLDMNAAKKAGFTYFRLGTGENL